MNKLSMKPKVLHLIGDKRTGGSYIYIQRLIDSHLEQKFDFKVLSLQEFRSQFKTFKPDIIIFHYPCAWKYFLALVWLKQLSKLVILDHHYCPGFEQHQVPSLSRFRLMLKLAYGLADLVISVSQAQRQWMLAHRLVSPHKLRVISGAVPVEKLLQIPLKILSQPLILGAYGRFTAQKGFDLLLQAFASLPPEQFQLYLGGYGQDEQIIQDLAQNLPHVKLLGAIDDVPTFLASCDVIIIPSRWEPWGLVCLEAKAAGKPVVISAVDGLKEQVQDYGLLFPNNDPISLAKAIASLPKHNLETWGQKARASVANSWNDFLNNWEKLLTDVIE